MAIVAKSADIFSERVAASTIDCVLCPITLVLEPPIKVEPLKNAHVLKHVDLMDH